MKDLFYRGRRYLKGKTTRDIGLARTSVNHIYISESLTPRNRTLFNECLKFKKEHNYKFIWTQNGHIYLRKIEMNLQMLYPAIKTWMVYQDK
jgi:hypothetical protein